MVVNILFISEDLAGGDLAYRLQREGHAVKLFVRSKKLATVYDGMVPKAHDWKSELHWVGCDGLIVFDSTGFGPVQDKLRKAGFSVVGGCALGDKLEDDRHFGKQIMEEYGIETIQSCAFRSVQDAIRFVSQEGGEWVIKQNGHGSKL
jgi:phosphoribosylamine-glycine ligase